MLRAGNGYAALLLEGVDGSEADSGPDRNQMGASGRSIFDANSPDRAGELYAPDRAVGVQSRI